MRDFEILAERYPREFVEQTGGNLAAMARELFVEKTATDVVCLEGLKVHCRILVSDLAGPDPSPVLRLAVEAALFCYLEHWVLTEDFPAGRRIRRAGTRPGAGRLHSTDTSSPCDWSRLSDEHPGPSGHRPESSTLPRQHCRELDHHGRGFPSHSREDFLPETPTPGEALETTETRPEAIARTLPLSLTVPA